MTLEEDDIAEFRELWSLEFNEKLTEERARFHAARLLELYLTLYQPTPETPAPLSESPPPS